tara:strand:+ start:133 stop:1803 length:1671 start_codon:yes stop_codon:yes gene_type:complete
MIKNSQADNLEKNPIIKILQQNKEFIILLAGLGFTLLLHFYQNSQAGLWTGEPSTHLTMQLETVHKLMAHSKDSFSQFIAQFSHLYYKFPKQGYDISSTIFSYLVFDVPPTLAEHKIAISKLQLAAFLSCCGITTYFLRKIFGWKILLIILILYATDIYNIVYSSFPRQNITAHFFSLILIFIYLNKRSKDEEFNSELALYLGIIAGIGSLFHYSCLEAVFIVVVTELGLMLYKRKNIIRAVSRILIFLGTIVAVWTAGDIFYYLCLHAEILKPGTKYPILEGMVLAIENTMINKTPLWKIEGGSLLFSLKYLLQISNPWLLFFSGFGIWRLWADEKLTLKYCAMLIIGMFMFFLAGSRFFAAARTLEHYMPYFLILAGHGIIQFLSVIKQKYPKYIPYTLISIMTVSILTQLPRIIDAKEALQGQYKGREYMKDNNIRTIFLIGRSNSLTNGDIKKINIQQTYEPICAEVPEANYLYAIRAIPIMKTRSLRSDEYWKIIEILEKTKPVIEFPQFNHLPLYYFEFPLKKEIYNRSFPMASMRRIYKVEDFKKALCN